MKNIQIPEPSKIFQSYKKNVDIVIRTKLQRSSYLSNRFGAQIYIKRQDMQVVRSFKIRGAGNAIRNLSIEDRAKGVVTASAGNHAQGVAYCCNKLQIKGTIYMPQKTPLIKVNSVRNFGKQFVTIVLVGNTFDEALAEARQFQQKNGAVFVHAFDNIDVIIGQGGIACEILEDWKQDKSLDYVFCCVGGGGLYAGVASYMKHLSPQTTCVGFQPLGSPSMYESLKQGHPVDLEKLDTFVDGAAIKKAGAITFQILQKLKAQIHLVPQGLVAATMLDIYNYQSLVMEPAGALSIAGLQVLKEEIKGKTIVCIVSGSNNQISRLPQIRLRSQIYKQIEAYYMIKIGDVGNIRLKKFIVETVKKQEQDIIMLIFTKKSQTPGSLILGLQFTDPKYKSVFEQRLKDSNYEYVIVDARSMLFPIISK